MWISCTRSKNNRASIYLQVLSSFIGVYVTAMILKHPLNIARDERAKQEAERIKLNGANSDHKPTNGDPNHHSYNLRNKSKAL